MVEGSHKPIPETSMVDLDLAEFDHGREQLEMGSPPGRPAQVSSNWRELMAVAKAIEYFQDQLISHQTLILLDNATAIAYVNKWGHKEPLLNPHLQPGLSMCKRKSTDAGSSPPKGGEQ